jgi:hypothetical protein
MKKGMLKSILSRKMLVALIMGFACGLPLLLTKGVLQAWMKTEGIDLSLIGLKKGLAFYCSGVPDAFHCRHGTERS